MKSELILSLAATTLIPAGLAAKTGVGATPKKMNVVLIMTDDMGYECLGCYGSTYQTPNLDRLAEEGIRFDYGFSQPLSTPSRVQIMTGKYNHKNYVQFGYLDQNQKTFGHLARQAGYATAIVGKWKLGQTSLLPDHFGFDSYCLWQILHRQSRYAAPLLEQDGQVIEHSIDAYGPDIQAAYAARFVEENKERPFLLYYPMVLTHDPFVPTPGSASWPDKEGRLEKDPKNFADMVAYTDKLVGDLVATLKAAGVYENTLLIFTGDNGTSSRIETPMRDGSLIRGGKGTTTDRGTHVPLIALVGGQRYKTHACDDLVDFTDMLPTIAEAMGVEVPAAWDTDGVSFLPRLLNKGASPRSWVFCHYDPFQKGWQYPEAGAARFIRDHRYKLYSTGELYDLQQDVMELAPIPEGRGSSQAEATRKTLAAQLARFPAWKRGDLPALPYEPIFELGRPKSKN